MTIKYRPDIDGLRAIAVLSVIIFHFFPSLLPGGFVGVDIFFVISGYLITSIIINDVKNRRFSFWEFYKKRIIRIFPALLAMLVAIYILGWFWFLQGDYKSLGKHIFGGSFFISNILLWRESGYFDSNSAYKPLLHLWSLGIEEQFYLFWPILLTLFARTKKGLYLTGTIILIISLAISIYTMHSATGENYYSPLSRCWELMLGALIASLRIKNSIQNEKIRKMASASGAVLIIIALATINSSIPFPGYIALIPVLGTGLLIYGENGVFNKIISCRPLVFIGLLSYPLYIWHWPIYSASRIMLAEEPSPQIRIASIALCFTLAYLTYKFIEIPIRRSTRKPAIAIALSCSVFGIGIIGLTTFQRDGLPFRAVNNVAENEYQEYASITNIYDTFHFPEAIRKDVCHSVEPDVALKNGCISMKRNQIFIWGDSYAASLYAGIQHLIETEGYKADISQATDGNGPPFFVSGRRTDSGKDLLRANNDRLKFVKEAQPAVIVIAWMVHGANASSDIQWTIKGLKKTINNIKEVSPTSRIVIFGPFPEWHEGIIRQIVNHYNIHKKMPSDYMNDGILPDMAIFDKEIKAAMKNEDVDYISSLATLCNDQGCLVRTGPGVQNLTSMDWGHLTRPGAEYLVEQNKGKILAGIH